MARLMATALQGSRVDLRFVGGNWREGDHRSDQRRLDTAEVDGERAQEATDCRLQTGRMSEGEEGIRRKKEE